MSGWSAGYTQVKLTPEFILVRKVGQGADKVRRNPVVENARPIVGGVSNQKINLGENYRKSKAPNEDMEVKRNEDKEDISRGRGERGAESERAGGEGKPLSMEERRREIQKIRDRELFGQTGMDGPNKHEYRRRASQAAPVLVDRGRSIIEYNMLMM